MNATSLVEQLKALGEPNRLAVAVRLADREWGAGELLDHLKMSQPSLSRHLKVLREAGVIRERRNGRHAYYRLEDSELPRLVVSLAAEAEAAEAARAGASDGTPSRHMHKDKSIAEDLPSDPEDDQPKSGSIEDWLL